MNDFESTKSFLDELYSNGSSKNLNAAASLSGGATGLFAFLLTFKKEDSSLLSIPYAVVGGVLGLGVLKIASLLKVKINRFVEDEMMVRILSWRSTPRI